jgi:hypothetical protein
VSDEAARHAVEMLTFALNRTGAELKLGAPMDDDIEEMLYTPLNDHDHVGYRSRLN